MISILSGCRQMCRLFGSLQKILQNSFSSPTDFEISEADWFSLFSNFIPARPNFIENTIRRNIKIAINAICKIEFPIWKSISANVFLFEIFREREFTWESFCISTGKYRFLSIFYISLNGFTSNFIAVHICSRTSEWYKLSFISDLIKCYIC